MSQNNQLAILRDAPVSKALVHLAVPAITTSLVMTLHNLIDTIYIGQLNDNAMIAATTVALPIMILIQALGDGIGSGTGSYVGRLLGARKEDQVAITVSSAMTMALGVSCLALLISMTVLKQLIFLFTDEIAVAQHAFSYMRILTTGAVFSIFKQVSNYILRSSGDVRYPMFTILLEVVVNIVLNPFLMFEWGLNMKIEGAALATVIAQAISAVLLMVRLIHHKTVIRWKFGDFKLHINSVKEIWRVGIATFIRNGLPSMSYGLYAKSAGLFGTDFVAAAGIARKGEQMANFVIIGMAHGYQPFASFNYGAKNKKRLLEAMKQSILFTSCYGALIALIFYFVPQGIMRIFTPDWQLIEVGKNILKIFAFGIPITGIYQILAGSFQATGKGNLSFLTSVLRQGIIYWPMVIILPRVLGEFGFTLVQPVCDWLSMIITCILAQNLLKEIREMPDKKTA